MSQEEQYQHTDEMTLADLLAVLLRFRRMILIGTIVTGLIGVLIWYVIPATRPSLDEDVDYVVEIEVSVASLPANISRYADLSLPALFRHSALDAVTILPSYEELLLESDDSSFQDQPQSERLRFLEQEFIGSKYEVEFIRDRSILIMRCNCGDEAISEQFLRSVVADTVSRIQSQVSAQLAPARAVLEQSLVSMQRAMTSAVLSGSGDTLGNRGAEEAVARSIELSVPNSVGAIADIVVASETAAQLAQSLDLFFVPSDETRHVVIPSDSVERSPRLVLSIAAAFFALSLIAFIRQYIQNVSKDSEQLDKLRQAWNYPRRRARERDE